MCGGPSQTQQTLQAEEAQFYKTQIDAYHTAYGNFSDINATLKAQFQPLLDKGPNQYGYTPEEDTALRTQATQGTAEGYAAAQRALQQKIATLGGGTSTINLTGGPMTQVRGQLATAGAQESARENLGITTSGYDLGRQMWGTAVQGEENLAAGWNPNQFAGSATSAAGTANSEANTIAQQGQQIWGSVLGALGGIGGSMAGGWASSAFKSPGAANYSRPGPPLGLNG